MEERERVMQPERERELALQWCAFIVAAGHFAHGCLFAHHMHRSLSLSHFLFVEYLHIETDKQNPNSNTQDIQPIYVRRSFSLL